LDWLMKTYPRLSNNVKNSKWVTDLLETWGPKAVKDKRMGSFDANTSTSEISVNTPEGWPRTIENILRTIGHEEFSHGYDARHLGSGSRTALLDKLRLLGEEELMYGDRLTEQQAKRLGDALVEAARNAGVIK